MRLRFAPSPTGQLHVSNARTALFNWLLARRQGGTFIVRIEDTDVERSTRESERTMLDDLRWLGLHWDEGPDCPGNYGPYRQSERLEIYRRYARELLEKGKAYRCYCTEEELEEKRKRFLAKGIPPKYDGRCRNLPPEEEKALIAGGRPFSLRFRVEARHITFEDQVKGRMNQATGKVKEEVGKAMDDTSMTIKGKAEKTGGKARAALGDMKNDAKNDTKKSSR